MIVADYVLLGAIGGEKLNGLLAWRMACAWADFHVAITCVNENNESTGQ